MVFAALRQTTGGGLFLLANWSAGSGWPFPTDAAMVTLLSDSDPQTATFDWCGGWGKNRPDPSEYADDRNAQV